MEDPNLLAFLQKVQYDVQEALQSNETVNLFKDEFKELGDEEIDIGNKNCGLSTAAEDLSRRFGFKCSGGRIKSPLRV